MLPPRWSNPPWRNIEVTTVNWTGATHAPVPRSVPVRNSYGMNPHDAESDRPVETACSAWYP